MYELIKECLPEDHSRQSSARTELAELVKRGIAPRDVLDLGCGDGRTIDMFRDLLPQSTWTGVDIETSPEVNLRSRNDGKFVTYDGVTLPFNESAFDLIYSHQVLEHCRFPEKVISEAFRVLRAGGFLVCSTSNLEPYHSYSFWNFTPIGLFTILKDAGLQSIKMRPGIDGLTLISRSLMNKQSDPDVNRYFSEESPYNQQLEDSTISVKRRNFRKLVFCGHIVAVCQKAPV
jgi:SAM-dependent methyltransferase